MRVYDTYERENNSEMAALATGRSGRSGWGSRLALLFAFLSVGLCAWAWVNNNNIVAWSLSQGLVGEAATRTLPSAVKAASVAGGILGLIAAGLAMHPVRSAINTVFSYMGLGISSMFRLLWLGVLNIAQLLALVMSHAWHGVSVVAKAATLKLRYVWAGVSAILNPIWSSVIAVARVIGPMFGYAAWRVVAVVARTVALVARQLWLGVYTVAHGISLGLYYLLGGILIVLYLLWLGVKRYIWPGVTAVLGYLQMGISTAFGLIRHSITSFTRVVAVALGHAWSGIVAVALAIGVAVGYLWRGVSMAFEYMGHGGAIVIRAVGLTLRYLWVGVSTVLSHLWRGVSIVAQAGGLTLRYVWVEVSTVLSHLWRGLVIVVEAFGVVVRYLWRGVSMAFEYMGHGGAIVIRAVGLTLRYVWVGISTVLGHLWRGVAIVARTVGLVLRYLWMGVFTILNHLWRGGYILARAVVLMLRYLWVVVSAVLSHLWRGGVIVAQAVSLALRYLWVGISIVLSHLWRGVSIVGRAVGLVMRYMAKEVSIILNHLWRGGVIVAQALGLVLRYLRVGVSIILNHLWRGVSIVGRAVGLAMRYLWTGGSIILSHLWRGVSIVGRAVGLVLRYLRVGVSIILNHLWRGGVIFGKAVGLALRCVWKGVYTTLGYLGFSVSRTVTPLGIGAFAICRYLWLGALTVALVFTWVLRLMWQGILVILQGMRRTPVFIVRTVWTAFTVSPDVLRAVVWVAKHRKGGTTMSDNNLTRERLLSLAVTVLVFFTVVSIGVRVFWPAPPEPTVEVVHWATGHLLRDWSDLRMLPRMATEFNAARYRTESGKLIEVEVYNSPSSEGAADLLCRATGGVGCHQVFDGEKRYLPNPTIVSPSSGHWLVSVNHEAGRNVVDLSTARSIARAFIGIVTYRDMAECLGWPAKELGYADIIKLRADPRGWKKYECAKTAWGERPLVAFTDPKTSSTGRSVLLALYAIAAGKSPRELSIPDVENQDVRDYVKEFGGLVDHYLIGTTVLNTKIHQGPLYGHFFIMPEDNLIHLIEGTELAFINGKKVNAPPIDEQMVMIYPKEGAMSRNNCACIVDAAWVTPEHEEAAEKWIDFLLEDEQQRSFMTAGFRPATSLSLADPSSNITPSFGLDPNATAELDLALMEPSVAAAIDESWEEVKRPGIVTIIADTSGSMMGNKLQQAKDGLIRALDGMATNNHVGLLSFDDTINTRLPVASLAVNRFLLANAIHELRARGETALYDAIKAGVEMTDAAAGDGDAIRAVVVLTDGRANRCQTRLDNLIIMESRFEKPILRFGGCEGDPPAKDKYGVTVEKEDIIGTELAIETVHPIQIFFIGIGDDADLEVGRILAGATGAEFRGVTEEDLANVLAELSGYF